jgi:signal transduction histidine kinase
VTSARPLDILLVEDNPGDARLIREILREADAPDFRLHHVGTLAEATAHLAATEADVVLLDLSLPDAHGLGTIRGLQEAGGRAPIIVLTGLDDETVALQALQEGAQDYLVKGRVEPDLLVRAMRYARERKHLERQQAALYERERAARASAEEAVRARDDVLRVVSHDIGNSLTAIGIHSRLLARSLPEEARTEQVRTRVAAIQDLLDQMESLRSDLLDVARIESGRLELDWEPEAVPDLLNEAAALISELAAERQITLDVVAPADLPPARVDRRRVLQVLGNLLGNALKFTEPSGIVTLSAHIRSEELHVSVADTGRGIPESDLPHLFDRYWQARSARRAGAGLGLAIARGIVEAHGGRIVAESVLGKGTTFTFSLPAFERGED